MFISFISPMYKVEPYINELLESFMPGDKDKFEIILVNDDPNQDYKKIIKNEYFENLNIKLINNKINKGLGFSRNIGIDNINKKSTHIFFVDSDDKVNIKNIIKPEYDNNKFYIFDHYRWFENKLIHKKPAGDIGKNNLPNYLWGVLIPIENKALAKCKENEQNDFPVVWRLSSNNDVLRTNTIGVYYRIRKSSVTWTKYTEKIVIMIINGYQNLIDERLVSDSYVRNIWEEILINKKSLSTKSYKKYIGKYKSKRKLIWSFNGTMYRITKWWRFKHYVMNFFSKNKDFE